MSVAIRTATRLVDQDDVNVTLGVGVDEYALCWDNDTARFVLRAPAAAPDLSGYALLAGRAGGQTLYGGTAANDDITIHGTSDATRTTSYVLLQPSGGNVGIGTSAPTKTLSVELNIAGAGQGIYLRNTRASGFTELVIDSDSAFAGGQGNFVFGYGGSTSPAPNTAYFYQRLNAALIFGTTNAERMRIQGNGLVGIGTSSPSHSLHVLTSSSATTGNALGLSIGHQSSGTPGAAFGVEQLFTLKSSTTAAQSAARIQALWYEATHATRKADLVLTAYDTAEREGLRIRGAGSAPAIGFYGVAPIARALLATGAGASVDDVITALQNLGLVKQS